MRTLAFLLLAALGASVSASWTAIPVDNHSFEDPALGAGDYFYSGGTSAWPTGQIPGWTSTATGGSDRGVWHTAWGGRTGLQVGFLYRNNAISQTLDHAILPGTRYNVDFMVSSAAKTAVELWAGGSVEAGGVTGGTLLASVSDTSISSAGLGNGALTWESPGSGSVIGQLLSLRVKHDDTRANYVVMDHFLVGHQPVPEPATIAALGLGVVALVRRGRSSRS